MQQTLGAVESVTLCQTQQLGDPRDIRLGQKALDTGQTIFEIRYVDRLIELFVIAHDIHIVTVPRVQRARAEDVVEHGIAVDVAVEQLAQLELLVRLKGDT